MQYYIVLLIIFIADKLNCRKILYVLTPVLLIGDLLFGKYSIAVFGREFPYILVRNFIFVGIPYFCIGCLVKNGLGKRIEKKQLGAFIALFSFTSILERYILVSCNLNAARDHYISTTFLAVAVFLFTLKSGGRCDWLATIGRKYSTNIYIVHPIMIVILGAVSRRIGVYEAYKFIAPIAVYMATWCFLMLLDVEESKITEKGWQLMAGIKTKVYAGRIKDRDILMKSSSGGAFTALSDAFLEHGDAIVAAVYNYQTHSAEFQLIISKEDRDKARGSKYMQSKPGDMFRQAEKWLKENAGKKILFVGMGCQADGFRKYAELKGIKDRVYIADIICHGSPSPKLWREYAASLEKRKGKITYLTFKDKRNGWKSPTAFVEINENEVPIKDYVKVFYNCCALRPSCHICPYATTERNTDITIGDFWHIEETIPDFYHPDGNSVYLIHTDRGKDLFDSIKINLDYKLSSTEQCWQKNLEAPTQCSEHRVEFWNDYKKKGVDFVMKKYGKTPLRTKIKNKVVRLISIVERGK